MENCKTFYKTQTAIRLKQIIHPSSNGDGVGNQINSNYIFQTNIFIEIYKKYTDISFKVLQEYGFWASRNDVAQGFFLTLNRNMFAEKFLKVGQVVKPHSLCT